MFSCCPSNINCCWRNNNLIILEDQDGPSHQTMTLDQETENHQISTPNQEIENKHSTETQLLAEWIVNPGILIQYIDKATNSKLILDVIGIAAEYLHNPDPQAQYIFGPEHWIKEYKDPKNVPGEVLKSILIDTVYLNDCEEAGSIVVDYLNNDFLVSETTFFTGNEESDNKLKKIIPTMEQEAFLQFNDPLNPGKKVEQLALRLFLPNHMYGKNLTSSEGLALLMDLIISKPLHIPEAHFFPLVNFILGSEYQMSIEGNGFQKEEESLWMIRPIYKLIPRRK